MRREILSALAILTACVALTLAIVAVVPWLEGK